MRAIPFLTVAWPRDRYASKGGRRRAGPQQQLCPSHPVALSGSDAAESAIANGLW